MPRSIALLLAPALLAVACSAGDGGEPVATPSSESTTAPGEGSSTREEAAVTTSPPTTQPAPALEGASGFEQLENFKATASPIDAALAELAAITRPIDGVVVIAEDGTVFPSLTHVLETLDENGGELSPEQAAAVDEAVTSLFDPDELLIEFPLFPDGLPDGEADEEVEGFAPMGFAASVASPGDEPTLDEAPAELQRLIRSAANDARAVLGGPPLNVWVQLFAPGAFGRVAGRNVSLDLADPRRDEFPTRPDCLVQLTSGPLPADIIGIIAHELTHCWQFTRIGFDVGRLIAIDDWAKEGMAGYIGEVVQPTRFNAEWWGGYLTTRIDGNGQWNMYTRSYDAIGFWSRIAAGGDVVAAMRRTMDASPSNAAMFSAATSDLGPQRAWLGAGTFERGDWGAGWTGSGPGSPGTPRSITSHTVIERNDIALSSDAGAQSNHEIAVAPVGGADGSVVTAAGTGVGVLRVDPDDIVLTGGTFLEEWCIGRCECPDGSAAFPSDRIRADSFDIAASLVGGARDATTLRVRTGRFDPDDSERCDEEEAEDAGDSSPPPGGTTDGLVGTWRANPDAVASVFEQASGFGGADSGFEVIGADGDVLMTFADDRTGTLDYDNVTLFLADQIIGDLTIAGTGAFSWDIVGGSIVISGTTFAYSVTSSAIGGELLTITDADVPTSGTTSLSGGVTGGVLTIASADGSAGRVFFPNTWIRQDG
jgi:hypothetical protein